ncbi:hypothetical protein [Polaromonas sp. YR568]|uniref:hypothetical protein n=1 Tax=Polaromonas sp. YR568 TaxID=1855301 RepID=UPI003137DF65
MFVLKNIFSTSKAAKPRNTGPETAPVKMNLEERMAFRRELLFEAIKTTMQAHGVLSSGYKTKVVRNDKRGHQYSVMMDLSTDFLHNEEGRPEKLLALGSAIAKNAEERYGLRVVGVYWQVNEDIKGFDVVPREATSPSSPTPLAATPQTARQRYERASAEELAAFEAAWQKGHDMQIGDRIYSSDLAPLGDDSAGRKR